ncbi:MAG TPA: beta-ketoacyl synthase N-terminal-like domain-containing protein [Solirubrobacteraceae bacterium]|nr:beta-ketoacyl synthase N-terminal-like domain-containing protein [Solirubrobacteraceae bacterium]
MSEPIAIVGMSCRFPGAPDVDAYWRNILAKVDAVSDPPPEAWDTDVYYDPSFEDTDKTYCKRGGYLGSLVSFDPLAHGIPPLSVGGEPDQWLALDVAKEALVDAGLDELPEQVRARTGIVLGKGTYLNGGNAVAVQRGLIVDQTLELLRQLHPEHDEEDLGRLREEMKRALPALGPERVAGLIPNIIVGRIANRLDLMGPTYTVDAACASSLIAIDLAMRDLRDGGCDLALAGGSQVWVPVPTLNLFCQLGALSRKEQIRPFDAQADGTLLGEGIGMVVLKRLSDAQRDGDRVYAAIRGVGVSSDGRGASVMAPRPEGEVLALRRAYEQTGLSPATIGLLEAHGTGTAVGDVVEMQALTEVFGERDGPLARCAVGTVKSMISHTIPASGVAGVIKLALALHHRVLPPTLHCDAPNPKLELERTPFYINTETRPWIHGGPEPRRAGINAFGFGGINAHAILEEVPAGSDTAHLPPWDCEVAILESDSAAGLAEQAARLAAALDPAPAAFTLTDLAATLSRQVGRVTDPVRLALVADSFADLRTKLIGAAERLAQPDCRRIKGASGTYYAAEPLARTGKLVLVFPGEGAQYPNMLSDLCLHFPEVRDAFDQVDRIYAGHPRGHLSSDWVFPRPAFSDAERREAEARLMQMDIAVESVLSANEAVHRLLSRLGVRPDACVGHSTGEFSAAHAAGVLQIDGEERRARFSEGLYACYADADARDDLPRAVLLAVAAPREQAEAIAREAGGDVCVAMDNCPHQAVLVGEPAAAERARAILVREGLIHEQLPYDRAVHTPRFAPFADRLRDVFAATDVAAPHTPLYSCTTTGRCPVDPAAIRELLVEHWVSPVEFRRTIEALYDEGARVFVECGPRGNLTAFIEDILRGRELCAVAADVQRRSGTRQLNHLVAMLTVHGVELELAELYAGRGARDVAWEDASTHAAPAHAAPIALASRWPMLRLPDAAVETLRATRAPAPAPALVGAPDGADPAIDGHLRTMQRFLSTQQEIMQAVLHAPEPGLAHPLLGEVVASTPGAELVARRVVDPASDPYLDDHRLGGGLAVMPLAMSLAILAEAAAELVGDLGVIGLRDVRAHRWLAFGDEPQTVEVRARVVPGDGATARVRVELRNLTEAPLPSPVVEATVLLAAAMPAQPTPLPALADARPSRWSGDELYREAMFHGPRWQAVRALEATGARGARARLEALPLDGFLRDAPMPELAVDPIALDAAGQVIGFWTAERLDRGKVVFPFRLAALDLHGPRPATGAALECTADIELIGDQLVRSDIDVRPAGGSAWMRLTGWEDKRFEVADEHLALVVGGAGAEMSAEWAAPIAGMAGGPPLHCRRMTARVPADGGPWLAAWSQRVLTRGERAQLQALRAPEPRRLEWLAARTAAKEAVVRLVRAHAGVELAPADVELEPDEHGRPVVVGRARDALGAAPAVSLSHSDREAVALAALGGRVGIDVERLRERAAGFADAAFGPGERRLLAGLPEEWTLRCWCAKEAVAKALGSGLLQRPRDAEVVAIDHPQGRITVRLAGRSLIAHSSRHDDLIVATTQCEQEGSPA